MRLLERLKGEILVGDGASGTLLYSFGIDTCYEELNLTNPERIAELHKEYIEAGADLIQTNTFGANYHKLKRYGLEGEVERINREGVRLAKEAAAGRVYVLGTIGGLRSVRKSELSLTEIGTYFKEQLDALLLEEPDGLILETYYDLEELLHVLEIARKQTNLPIVANISLHEVGLLQNGMQVKDAFDLIKGKGADIIGLNCRMGPYHMIRSFEEVPLREDAFYSAYPNASLPDFTDGRYVYSTDADYFVSAAKQLVEQGVRLIGGCCGTTPAYVRAIKKGILGLVPLTEKKEVISRKSHVYTYDFRQPDKETILGKVKKGPAILVELDPPKTLGVEEFMKGSRYLHEMGADAITLADNSLASPRISNVAIASLLKAELKKNPLVHLTCRDHNLIGLQSHLMGMHTIGLNEVLIVTGDPSKIGDFPGATSVYDLSSIDLISLVKQFNAGISYSGKSLGGQTNFEVAAAFNPNVKYVDKAVVRMEKKIQAGADYFLTQPVFSVEKIREVYEATRHIKAPIFIGIMPLTSYRNASFLHNEVPGITLPEPVLRAMEKAGTDAEASMRESLAISKELLDAAAEYFNGHYIITPFMRYELSGELVAYASTKKSVISGDVFEQ
ncbi:homocysteine methyltransferase [Bacillus sp. FJAT-27916]|uniref:bifunctional homocysteine S-methyltransferase/methylenetetrahydrofolate reductase n=1 Tax=Bacillus sp. FJAT-27916 TaxID=1679169 RepID=UPI0006716D3C|nr:bifunctional homocysteine S-methyltransferase/methylenetetrahydrofolate reductase [Bacillus sp. FJAT-27916]KMY44290.1 homocysteine methyltransferase [Bacillus sp. FJAT-27916]